MSNAQQPGRCPPGRQAGFSLVELLIVVAIIGILGAIAYPSYVNYVRESRRTDAMNALLTMANEQEKHFLSNNTYGATADVWQHGTQSLEEYYNLSATGNATGFTLRATAVAGTSQAQDTDCLCFELTEANQRRAYASTACTGTDNGAACW